MRLKGQMEVANCQGSRSVLANANWLRRQLILTTLTLVSVILGQTGTTTRKAPIIYGARRRQYLSLTNW